MRSDSQDPKLEPAYGTDLLRIWVASVDSSRDVLIGPGILSQTFEGLRKIRNTARFMLGNIAGQPREDFRPEELGLVCLNSMRGEVQEGFTHYLRPPARHRSSDTFFTSSMSSNRVLEKRSEPTSSTRVMPFSFLLLSPPSGILTPPRSLDSLSSTLYFLEHDSFRLLL